MSENKQNNTQVLVVGAGPVGLTMASELLARGIRCHVIDQNAQAATTSRALGVHSRTLEILDNMGIAQEIVARCIPTKGMTSFHKGKPIFNVKFDASHLETPFPYSIFFAQTEIEQALTNRLQRLGGQIERNVKLESFTQATDGVTVNLVHQDNGQCEQLQVDWLIGCDGAHSSVRHQLGLSFEGSSDETWLVADVEIAWSLPKTQVYLFFLDNDEGTVVAFPFPDGNRWRLLDTHATKTATPGYIAAEFTRKLATAYHAERVTMSQPTWTSVFTIQQRRVNNMRSNRCFVAGDAAHVHSPAGAQGMNTGIQDAYNLAWKLALVTKGLAPNSLLDSYSEERESVAASVLQGSLATTRVLTLSNPLKRFARNTIANLVYHLPFLKRRISLLISQTISGLVISYPASSIIAQDVAEKKQQWWQRFSRSQKLQPGQRVPNIAFYPDSAGEKQLLYNVLKGQKYSLLLFGAVDKLQNLESLATELHKTYGDWLNSYIVLPTTQLQHNLSCETPTLVDVTNELRHRFGIADSESGLYLIRPDWYIAYHNQPVDLRLFYNYLVKISTPKPVAPTPDSLLEYRMF